MSRVLLVLIVVLALVGGGLWLGTAERGPRAAQPVAPAPAEPVRAAADVAPPPAVAATPSPSPAPASAPATREAAAGTLEAELAGAQWVAGRVVFPAGTPLDEEAFVVADGKDFADGKDQRARVESDGRFRVAFSAETRSGSFRLEARYLYLDKSARWKRGGDEPVLEPKLGARIEGRVTPPPGADAASAIGKVQLASVETRDSWDTQAERAVAADLAFHFDALAPREALRLDYDGASFLGHSETFALEPGKTVTVALELQPGVVLGGVVHDESGAPLAKVELQAYVQTRSLPWSLNHNRMATTGADGRFRLDALAAGDVQLDASLQGYRPAQQKLAAQKPEASRAELEFVLERGQTIAGSVRWPDGTPAEAALALTPASQSDPFEAEDAEVQGKSDASGRFTISGLGEGSYRVKAQAVKKEEVTVKSELTGKDRKKTVRSQWSAEAAEVRVGTSDLALTLSTGLALAGRVVDDLGQPLASFRVHATQGDEAMAMFGDGPAHSYRDTDGSFSLDGFTPGEWSVIAEAKGHSASAAARVSVPSEAALTLVVPREATLGGVVLDASGAPVEGARLIVERAEEHAFFDDDKGKTDAHGSFRITGLAPGSVELRAEGSAGAPSAPLALELVAGQALDGLVLRLERGTRLDGEVVSASGRPLAGVSVWVYSEAHFNDSRETDAQGHFEFANVPPGDVHVSAETAEGLHLNASVTVVAGENAHVRLTPPDQLVQLRGRVRAAGEPLAEAQLYAHRLDDDEMYDASGSSAESGADGTYELALPGAGRYQLSVNAWKAQRLSWNVSLEVPAVESFTYDVSIALGRISGRVRDAAGKPLAGIEVESEPEQHDGGAGSGEATTDADGRYELVVPAGRHLVHAGGVERRSPSSANYAEARVGGLVLAEGAELRGVDLVLVAGGALEGRARHADGTPAVDAEIVAEQDGHTRYLGDCDDSGAFHIDGLAPGVLSVRAMSQGGATAVAVSVEIVAGETRHVDFELVPAAYVHVRVRDASNALVGSELSALDAHGQRQPVHGGSQAGDAWLGPLVAGHYTVRAQRDQKTVERELEVTGKEEKLELELVFE